MKFKEWKWKDFFVDLHRGQAGGRQCPQNQPGVENQKFRSENISVHE